MLIADIKNKLTLSELTSEDFLTSSVFSAFKYIEEKCLEKFLNQAVNIKKKRLDIKIENPIYEFWPWYSAITPLRRGAEPDIVILSGETAIIIEAKNYSEKSGVGTISLDSEDTQEKDIIDQLGREYFIGLKKLKGSTYSGGGAVFEVKDFIIIFLTRHTLIPVHEIEETIESVAEIDPKELEKVQERIYWLNWQKAIPIFEEIVDTKNEDSFESKLSRDLLQFLERRDLGLFCGFAFLDKFSDLTWDLSSDCLFYHKVFKKYWSFLDSFQLDFSDTQNIFYSKGNLSYWDYLIEKYNFKSRKTIFYGGQ